MGRKAFITRLVAAGAAVGALAASGLAGATALPTSGDGITPVYRDGNNAYRDCEAATGAEHIMGFKLTRNSVSSYNGTYGQSSQGIDATHKPDNPMQVTVSNAGVSGGAARLAWSANMPVDYVIVKAGNGATIYDYTSYGWGGHPATGPWGDTGLVSPKDSISHILFCTLKKLRVEKTAAGSFDQKAEWTIDKQVKAEGGEYGANATIPLTEGGTGKATWRIVATRTEKIVSPKVAGTITVLNTAPFSTDVALTESLAGATFGAGCPTFTLAKGASKTCSYSAALARADAGLNTVQARATDHAWMPVATGTAPYAFTGAPGTVIDGTVSWDDSNGRSRDGITQTDVHEYDQSVKCGTGLRTTERQETVNEVVLRGEREQELGRDTATLAVECAPATKQLLVAKTADLHWKRVSSWGEAKSASPSSHALVDGATGATTWSVDVTRTGVESFYLVAGTITVKNPNAYDVPGVTIAESMKDAQVLCGLGGAAKSAAAPVTIPAGGTLNCTYTAQVAENAGGVNSVSVTSGIQGIGGEASDTWQALEQPNAGDVNAAVSVVDARLAASWTADASDDDRQLPETLPCANATVVNSVELRGDNPATEAVETDHVLAQASAQVTTTCAVTPRTPETPTTPDSPKAPETPTVPETPATPKLAPPVAKPVAKPVVKGVAKAVKVKPAAVARPVVKAKPVAKPTVRTAPQACIVVRVSTKTLPAGNRSRLGLVATAAGKPVAGARIRLVGPGISKVVRTGAAGRVTTAINPRAAGIVEATAAGRSCSSARIGVIAAFEPPVTG